MPEARLRSAIERLAGVRIMDSDSLPRGIDVFADLRNDLPGVDPRVVLDVGAHRGESVRAYLRAFPAARIYSFEPIGETFSQLSDRFTAEPRVECFRLAIGAEPAKGTMTVLPEDTTLSSLSPPARVAEAPTARAESVEIETLDRFCAAHGIEHVDFLKVDTEGHDLDVLRGAEDLLGAGAIELVEVESGMSRDNATHVRFESLKEHLEEKGYRLFALYQQMREWPTDSPHLRRVDAVFISAPLVASRRS
jgi:FkbM family methyltransferase